MSGENSKKSGEIGEKLASALLEKIGWQHQIHNISISCNNSSHINASGSQKKSHGDDIVYIYDNPFHDETTVVAHVSVKHNWDGYSNLESDIRRKFNKDIKELEQIIQCAQYNSEIDSLIESYKAKVNVRHIGVLVWLHNDKDNIDRNILSVIARSKPSLDGDTPYYVIDSGRASFLLKVINNLSSKSNGNYQFYYPKIGTSILVDSDRKGKFLPIELISSDIITAVVDVDGKNKFYLYSREGFNELTCKNMMAYALNFSAGLINDICIGFPDYNPTQDNNIVNKANLSFKERSENIQVFSYNESILNLFQE